VCCVCSGRLIACWKATILLNCLLTLRPPAPLPLQLSPAQKAQLIVLVDLGCGIALIALFGFGAEIVVELVVGSFLVFLFSVVG
jgi:hypothetical protein